MEEGERERREGGRGVKEKQNALPFLNEAEGYERAEATNEERRNAATNAAAPVVQTAHTGRPTDGRTDEQNGWTDIGDRRTIGTVRRSELIGATRY